MGGGKENSSSDVTLNCRWLGASLDSDRSRWEVQAKTAAGVKAKAEAKAAGAVKEPPRPLADARRASAEATLESAGRPV